LSQILAQAYVTVLGFDMSSIIFWK